MGVAGIFIQPNATMILKGTIVAGNLEGASLSDISGNVDHTSTGNLIDTGGDGGLAALPGNQANVSLANVGLGTFGNHGGPAPTYSLLANSLALGHGLTATTQTTDERGVARPVNQPGDVGAYQLSAAPSVTTNPTSKTINVGGSTSFSAVATDAYNDGSTVAPTVQWQISTDGGNTFVNLGPSKMYSGVNTTTLTITGATAAMNGFEFQAVFTNTANLITTTSPVTLTVDFAPGITTSPSSSTVDASNNTSFTAAASGNPTPSVQWQVSTDGGNTFNNLVAGGVYGNSVNSPTLTITGATAAMNGFEYQAVFTNSIGTATTTAATLTVDFAPGTTTNPSNATINAGTNTSFTAAATGNPTPGVQWQVSTDGGNTFSPLTPGGVYGNSVNSLTLTITGATAAMNGFEYQAVFTNSIGTATTTAATLTVDFAPGITTSPSKSTVDAGNNLSLTAAATGNPTPSVQWQVSTDGGNTFNNLAAGGVYGNSVNSPTLTITGATVAMDGSEYRAVFTNSVGTATTTVATLIVDGPVIITKTTAGQGINDNASINPFSTVTLSDPDSSTEMHGITVTLNPANGTLSNLSGGSYNPTTSVYTLFGVTLSQAQQALQTLTFTPTAHQVAPGQTVTTSFTLSISDDGGTATDSNTSVITIPTNTLTTITGAAAGQPIRDYQTTNPFSAVTFADPDNSAETHSLSVALSSAASGSLSNLSGGTYNAATGVYTLNNVTLSQARAALRALTFTPTAHQVPAGQSVVTTFTITVGDGSAGSATDSTASVVTTDTLVNIGPVASEGNNVKIFTRSGSPIETLTPFGPRAQTSVIMGDVTGDGIPDLVVATTRGGAQVKVYDGVTGQQVSTFNPYGTSYTAGVNVAVGDVKGTGHQDLIVGPGGANKRVKVIDPSNGSLVASFFPFPTKYPTHNYTAGVRVAAGDLAGTGKAEVIVGTAPPQRGYAEVWGFNGSSMVPTGQKSSVAGEGVFLATEKLPTSGHADLIVGSDVLTAPGSQAGLFVLDGVTFNAVTSLPASNPALSVFSNGNAESVRLGVRDVTGKGAPNILVATGAGATQEVRVFDFTGGGLTLDETFSASQLGFSASTAGTYVG
jgi:hypothetical protein